MNQKGFVLVESIVTSVFVLGLFTFIVGNILPLIAEYDKGMNYDTVESMYDAHLIRKMILKNPDGKLSSLINFPQPASEAQYFLFDKQDICLYLTDTNYCQALLSRSFLDVKKIIITNLEITDKFIEESKNFDRATREYILQMERKVVVGASEDTTNYRRLIIAFNDGRVTSIELKVPSTIGGVTC